MNSVRRSEAPVSPSPLTQIRVQGDEGRQTPRRVTFGEVLAQGVRTALWLGTNLLAPPIPGGIALAASAGAASGAAGGLASGAAGGLAPGAAGMSSEAQLLQQQEAMRARDRMFNLQYLDLQRKVQEDQRQFQVLTHLLKTQHDTVKTAINNLR
jgi:hypothetical protein